MNVPKESDNATVVWQKLCAVNQRILLAHAVEKKLSLYQMGYPEEEKHRLLQSLNDEMALLVFVKQQLEETMIRYFSQSIVLNDLDSIRTDTSFIPSSETMGFPLTHVQTSYVSNPKVAGDPVASNPNKTNSSSDLGQKPEG